MRECGFGQRREVEERRIPRPPIGQHAVAHRNLARGLAPDPTLRERAHVVLGWNGLDHGDRERERVLFRRLLAMKREVLVMVNVLGLGIFDPYNPWLERA